MRTPAVAALMSVAFVACGESEPVLIPPIGFDMSVRVEPSTEVHACQFVRMPDDSEEIFVGGGFYNVSAGTHHFLLFRTAPDMPEQPLGEPVDCYEGDGIMQYERGYVSGGQLQHESADFPSTLALPFEPGEVLLMQTHIVNAASEPIDASVHVELRRVAPESVHHRVGTFRFYNPFVHVPAGGASTAAMRCHIHQDLQLVTAGAHMHARGVAYRAFVDVDPDEPAAEPFYTTNEWQHPDYFAGLVDLPAGSAVRFACDYENPTAADIVQGTSAIDDEMCMLSAFYFPAADEDEELCVSMDRHGTGNRSCAQTTSCIQLCDPDEAPKFSEGSADVGACFQACIVDSCPSVTGALFPQLLCTAEHCSAECETYGSACTSCVVNHCKPELDACQALACGEQDG